MSSIEHILLAASILLLLSVLASKASAKLGVPALLLFLVVGMLAGSDGAGGIYFVNSAAMGFGRDRARGSAADRARNWARPVEESPPAAHAPGLAEAELNRPAAFRYWGCPAEATLRLCCERSSLPF